MDGWDHFYHVLFLNPSLQKQENKGKIATERESWQEARQRAVFTMCMHFSQSVQSLTSNVLTILAKAGFFLQLSSSKDMLRSYSEM